MSAVASVTLTGRYARLDPLSRADIPALVQAAQSGSRETFAFASAPGDESGMRAWVEAALADQAAGTALPFTTRAAGRGDVVGGTRFGRIEFWDWPTGSPEQRGADLPDVAEIGWTWLAPAAQRTGINTEVKYLMLRHAFETWRVHRISLRTDVRNTRSQTAIERIGGKRDGVLRAHMLGHDGTLRHSAFYSILDTEWPEVRTSLERRLATSG